MTASEPASDLTRRERLRTGTEAPAAKLVAEPLLKKCAAEFVGTGILVFFGLGVVLLGGGLALWWLHGEAVFTALVSAALAWSF